MPYPTTDDLINDVAAFYDDTDTLQYTLPTSKKQRYLHYIQRTVDEIHNYRNWSWKMIRESITFTNRQATVPANFANIGANGGLFDPTGEPWAEITFQNMVAIISSAARLTNHLFCVGTLQDDLSSGVVGEGGNNRGATRGLIIPDPNNTQTFTVFYESSPPRIFLSGPPPGGIDVTAPPPLPEAFHNCLLLGTVAKLQEGKGDPRSIWRSEYVAALAKQVALLMPLNSRTKQMPMSVGMRRW